MLRGVVDHPEGLTADGDSLARAMLARSLLYRGHLRDASSLVDRYFVRLYPHRVVQLALFGAISHDSAAVLFASWLREPGLTRSVEALPWWSAHGDTSSLRRVRVRADSVLHSRVVTNGARIEALFGTHASDAYLALAHHDTVEALRQLAALPDSLCPIVWCYLTSLDHAKLLLANRDAAGAARLLDAHPPDASTITVSEVLWSQYRARAAERLGEPEVSRRHYSFVLKAWANADSSLRLVAGEARDALIRLPRR
jgi:hypothetical protein